MIYRVNNIFEDPPNRGKLIIYCKHLRIVFECFLLKNLLFCLIVVVFFVGKIRFFVNKCVTLNFLRRGICHQKRPLPLSYGVSQVRTVVKH